MEFAQKQSGHLASKHRYVRERFAVHSPDPHKPAVRFVCSRATTDDDVDAALHTFAQAQDRTI